MSEDGTRIKGRDTLLQYSAAAVATLSTSATLTAATYVTIADQVDDTINDEYETFTVDVKGQKFADTETAARKFGVTTNIKAKKGSATLAALKAAYEAGTKLAFRTLDGPVAAGTTGECFIGVITKFPRSRPLGDVVSNDIEIAKTSSLVEPVPITLT